MGAPLFLLVAVCVCGSALGAAFDYEDTTISAVPPVGDAASMRLLKETYTLSNDKNVVTSPIGVFLLLSLYSAGAEGPIRDEIVSALGHTDYEEFSKTYSDLSWKYIGMNNDYFNLANKAFVDNHYELLSPFQNLAIRSYNSEIGKVDFKNVKEVVDAINKWSDENTKGHIKTPVEETDIDPEAIAALVNVIFFQGHWHVPFNASYTVENDFHVDSRTTVKKPTMRLEIPLFYHDSQELGAKMVQLPYQEKGFSMVIVLPNEIDGLPSVLEKAAQKGIHSEIANLSPAGRDIRLEMPKFEVRNKLDLNNILPKIGVSKIFWEKATGILSTPVKVDKALQEAFIKVDEEGATAGAFTGFVLVPECSNCGPPPPLDVKVDHPFLFTILYENVVIFAGTYTR